jgi:hypothetical protein
MGFVGYLSMYFKHELCRLLSLTAQLSGFKCHIRLILHSYNDKETFYLFFIGSSSEIHQDFISRMLRLEHELHKTNARQLP